MSNPCERRLRKRVKEIMWKNDSASTIVIGHRQDITASNHPEQGVYLRRWYVFRCPLGGAMVHKIMRPDADRDLHDHPWAFLSVVLKGGYVQQMTDGFHTVTRINRLRHGTFHRIHLLRRSPTWTVVITGPKRSTWGFMTKDGWIPWREYTGVS